MTALQFIFSSFWVWLGFVVLVCAVGGVVVAVVKTCKHSRKITGYRIGERWHITVEDGTAEDVRSTAVSLRVGEWIGDGNGQDEAEENEPNAVRDNQD